MLWIPRGSQPPVPLVNSLVRSGAAVESCTDAFAALARACRGLSAGRPHEEGPSSRRGGIVLLVTPQRLEQRAEFLEAVRRYAPRCTVWWYDASKRPPLRAVTSDDVREWLATPGESVSAPAAEGPRPAAERPAVNTAPWTGPNPVVPSPAAPRLRLTVPAGESPAVEFKALSPAHQPGSAGPPSSGVDVDAAPAALRDVLTPEELAMLLDDLGPPAVRDERSMRGGQA